ncbi:MAG: hypothetical protein KC636_35240, partial [Myxococcales bacterium]|nr:hypothetical protein [Myxococcales bacterium]
VAGVALVAVSLAYCVPQVGSILGSLLFVVGLALILHTFVKQGAEYEKLRGPAAIVFLVVALGAVIPAVASSPDDYPHCK